jgi:cell division protease FtsH
VAVLLVVNQKSTGASNDFERATKIARAMVTKYGMSDALGIMVYEDDSQDGGYFGKIGNRAVSEATQQLIDQEIRSILETQYTVARDLIEANKDKIEIMVEALLKWETIERDQIIDIMEGRQPREPKVYEPINPVPVFVNPAEGAALPPPLPVM